MLSDFIADHRDELIQECAAMVAKRPHREATPEQLKNGIPLFLGQLRNTLAAEQRGLTRDSLRISGAPGGEHAAKSEIGLAATEHGKQLFDLDYTVDQVVHDYGDLCQVITSLASAQDASIEVPEFATLNRCLDNAIAVAVAAFSEREMSDHASTAALDPEENLELRSSLAAATYAARAMELGNLPMSGATGRILKQSLAKMRNRLGEPPSKDGN